MAGSFKERLIAHFGGPSYTNTPYEHMIEVRQYSRTKFAVIYGLSEKRGLKYEEAAREFGYAVFHYQTAQGVIDNE